MSKETWPRDADEDVMFRDWQYEVANFDTVLGFRDWVQAQDELA